MELPVGRFGWGNHLYNISNRNYHLGLWLACLLSVVSSSLAPARPSGQSAGEWLVWAANVVVIDVQSLRRQSGLPTGPHWSAVAAAPGVH